VITNQEVLIASFPQYGKITFGNGQGDISDN